jgi:hypothetical protein
MADTTFASNIIIDPKTLLGTTQAVLERISPQVSPLLSQAIEPLRLLFIDTRQRLFVFGAPDQTTLSNARIYAQPALEKALGGIFEEQTRVQLALFRSGEDSLADLIAGFEEQPGSTGEPVEGSTGSGDRDGQAAPAPEEEASNLNKIQLDLIQSSLRSVFTSPRRVVVVPGYLLRWLPYLGPLRASIVVACFQAFYLSRSTAARAKQTFEAPAPFIAAMAGIAESSVWRHLEDAELGWFLEKVPYDPNEEQWVRDESAGVTKRRPNRFLFRSTSPLTPGDAQALHAYLTDLDIQEDPTQVLTDLVKGDYRVEPRDVFPFPATPPPENWPQGDPNQCLIHNVIYAAIGIEAKAASKALAERVDELAERLLPPNDQVHLSWYFLLHWQPLLGHGPSWATILLRDRCFYNRQTGELRDTVRLRDGYQELAGALGLKRLKTLREWFPAPHAQKEAIKSAQLSSRDTLAEISLSKRRFVKEYAAKFVEIIEAEADGRGQVSSFKVRVQIFDPLTPFHKAIYDALFPLAQGYFNLPPEHQTAFLNAFDDAAAIDASAIENLIQKSHKIIEEIIQTYRLSIQPGLSCELDGVATEALLGAIERIAQSYSGAKRRIADQDLGANEEINTQDSGAFGGFTPSDLGAFERLTALISGAFDRISMDNVGAIERLGLIFWAQIRGLKHLVLNNHLDESLKNYFQNTLPQNTEDLTTTTTSEGSDELGDDIETVVADSHPIIQRWDLDKLLNNFNPAVKQSLFGINVSVEAVISCLLYIASSKGDNLGLGYVVEKLKAHPQEGQGGVYRRIAGQAPQEIVDRLGSYLEYRSFRNRDWRMAMGTPSTDKILELLDHLGLDASKFTDRWDEDW